jgi:hypothetical protein
VFKVIADARKRLFVNGRSNWISNGIAQKSIISLNIEAEIETLNIVGIQKDEEGAAIEILIN